MLIVRPDGKLVVRDEGSHNGVFMRIRTPVPIESGGAFLVGEQLLQVEAAAPAASTRRDTSVAVSNPRPNRIDRSESVKINPL